MPQFDEDKAVKIERLGKDIKVAQAYINLSMNPDFIFWKAAQIDLVLEKVKVAILNIDRNVEGWQEKLAPLVATYQELDKAFNKCFVTQQTKYDEKTKKLKELQ